MGWGGMWEGGSGWGTHVNPWLIPVNVWQKPLQYCKVTNLPLIKINVKKQNHWTLSKPPAETQILSFSEDPTISKVTFEDLLPIGQLVGPEGAEGCGWVWRLPHAAC